LWLAIFIAIFIAIYLRPSFVLLFFTTPFAAAGCFLAAIQEMFLCSALLPTKALRRPPFFFAALVELVVFPPIVFLAVQGCLSSSLASSPSSVGSSPLAGLLSLAGLLLLASSLSLAGSLSLVGSLLLASSLSSTGSLGKPREAAAAESLGAEPLLSSILAKG
jgi:hypothetical protein